MGPKNILLIIIAFALIGGAFILAEFRNKKTEKVVYQALVATSTSVIPSELQYQDSDKDGLKDWEEVLLGIDSKNPDSDGDGTTDGEEVVLNRNPLVKGPKDKMETSTTTKIAQKENLTQTDIMARDFFARYMELRQLGISENKINQEELIQEVMKNGIVISTPKLYTSKSILSSSASGKDAIKKYGNDIGKVFRQYSSNARNEVAIAKESIDKEDPEVLKELDPIIKNYKNIISGLLKVPAPQAVGNLHLRLVNSIYILQFNAELLKKSESDGVSALQGVSNYMSGAKEANEVFNALKNYFDDEGVFFDQGEAGAYFIPN